MGTVPDISGNSPVHPNVDPFLGSGESLVTSNIQIYNWSNNIATPYPAKSVSVNSTDPKQATRMRISKVTTEALDVSRFMTIRLIPGRYVYVQDTADASKYMTFRIIGPAETVSDYLQFDVVCVEMGSPIVDTRNAMVVVY